MVTGLDGAGCTLPAEAQARSQPGPLALSPSLESREGLSARSGRAGLHAAPPAHAACTSSTAQRGFGPVAGQWHLCHPHPCTTTRWPGGCFQHEEPAGKGGQGRGPGEQGQTCWGRRLSKVLQGKDVKPVFAPSGMSTWEWPQLLPGPDTGDLECSLLAGNNPHGAKQPVSEPKPDLLLGRTPSTWSATESAPPRRGARTDGLRAPPAATQDKNPKKRRQDFPFNFHFPYHRTQGFTSKFNFSVKPAWGVPRVRDAGWQGEHGSWQEGETLDEWSSSRPAV